MAENPAATDTTTTPPPAAVSNTDPPAQSTQEPSIPKSRFDEVNTRAKAAEAELEKIKADQAAASEAEAKKRGEWEKLATEHAARISDLQPKLKAAEETRDRYSTALEGHVKALRKGVPDHIGALLDRLDPVDQLEWITKNQELVGAAAPVRGAGPGPRSVGSTGRDDQLRVLEAEMKASGRYPRF